jgi:hypothetical protein
MRFNSRKGEFPRPVLRPEGFNGSYVDCEFEFGLKIDAGSSPTRFIINSNICQAAIVSLLESGEASLALAVNCENTYYYELFNIPFKEEQYICLDEKHFIGRVYFNLVVKANRDIDDFSPGNLISAFSGMSFDVEKGDILAVSQEVDTLYKLPPLDVGETIFRLDVQPGLSDDEFQVGFRDGYIVIGVGPGLNELLQQNMATVAGREKNVAAVYFPALIQVLHDVQDESHEGDAWYEVIALAMSAIGFEINDKESWKPLRVAQLILKSPYLKLLKGKDS